MGMEFQHELIIPNEGLPFKLFLFEGRNGSTVCFFTFVTDISTESIKDRGALTARRSLEMTIFGKRMLIFRKIFIQERKR